MLYQELLEFAKPRIDDFFKNVTLFDNAFCWSDFNHSCFENMYMNNSYDELAKMKDLKATIPELSDMCKRCKAYYMKQRNDSIVKYDLIEGQLLENILIDFLKQRLGINCVHGDVHDKRYPDCMVLGPDKGIVAYFEVKYHAAPFLTSFQKINRPCYEGSATLDYKKIVKQLEIIESDLERPVFYLHWIDYPCVKGIFFETSEQVKDYLYNTDEIFVRDERKGDLEKAPESRYYGKFYSPLLYMGTFEEFVEKIKAMRG